LVIKQDYSKRKKEVKRQKGEEKSKIKNKKSKTQIKNKKLGAVGGSGERSFSFSKSDSRESKS